MSDLSKIISSNFENNYDSPLLRHGSKTYKWGDIDKLSNHVAYQLGEKNKNTPRVAFIALSFGNEFLSSVLACIKLGIPYIPLPNEDNNDNCQSFLDDPQLYEVVLIDKYFLNSIDYDKKCHPFSYDPVDNNSPLYGIMTSGTTGKPKIPLIPHNAIIHLANVVRNNINEVSTWSSIHSVSFGFSTFEYFMPLMLAKTIIAPINIEENSLSNIGPLSLAQYLQKGQNVDVACFTPSGLTLFLQWIKESSASNMPKYIILSGEALNANVLNSWRDSQTSNCTKLINTFAAAESGGQLFWNEINYHTKPTQLGQPLPHVNVFILDQSNNIIHGSGTGRLAICSESIAIDDLSNSQSLSKVFLQEENRYALLLDDIVERNPENEYFYVGRTGSKIKHKGALVDLNKISQTASRVLDLNVFSTIDLQYNATRRLVSFATHNLNHQIELWPALGEFNEYDSYTYQIMAQDGAISRFFKNQVQAYSTKKTILDLGCGGNLLVSKLALEAGAEHVFAYEIDHRAYSQAKELILKDQLDSNKLSITCADVSRLASIEHADCAITRVFGNIASADGVIPLVKNVNRISTTNINWLPEIVKTKIACVDLPVFNPINYVVTPEAESFFKRLEKREQCVYRGRLCIRNFKKNAIISSVSDFETLNFNLNDFSLSELICLTIVKNSSLSGFILWVSTYSSTLEPYDNYISSQKGWLPVYLPLSASPINVIKGDVVKISCTSTNYSSSSPDYHLNVSVYRDNKLLLSSAVKSNHTSSKHDTHYALLDSLRYISNANIDSYIDNTLRAAQNFYAQPQALPEEIILLKSVPLTKNNKIDTKYLEYIYSQIKSKKSATTSALSDNLKDSTSIVSRDNLVFRLLEIIAETTNKKLSPKDNFFEVGLASLDFASISALASEVLGKTVTLSMIYDHPSCDSLASKLATDYPDLFNQSVMPEKASNKNTIISKTNSALDPLDFKIFASQAISKSSHFSHAHSFSNNIAFILSPPRSGSTLLRVLLAGIDSILAPPELELLRFESLQDWTIKFSGKDKLWREGLIEFLMYIYKFDELKACTLIEKWVSEQLSVPSLYSTILSSHHDKYFIEKSTYYALFPSVLDRISTLFPSAKIIHLVRNPIACINSYSDLRLDTYSPFPINEYTPSQVGELIWTTCHQNILKKFSSSSNYKQIFYDNIVCNVDSSINSILNFLELDESFMPNLSFTKDNKKLMISGVNDNSKMLGDPNFFKHSKISKIEDLKWIFNNTHRLSQKTINLAEKLFEHY